MSITVLRPPRPPPVRTTYGNQRVYTLHSDVNHVFAWHLSGTKRYKSVVVAFKHKNDAELMAHVIERHVIQNKEWPDCSVIDNTFKLYGGIVHTDKESSMIHVHNWQVDTLKVFCAETYFDMIILNKIRENNNTFKISGEILMLDVPEHMYIERLKRLYGLFDIDED